MYGKSNMETYISHCQGDLLNGSGNSKGLCISLEGLDGEGDGREVQKGGDICLSMVDSC